MTFPVGTKVLIRVDSRYFPQGTDDFGKRCIGEVTHVESDAQDWHGEGKYETQVVWSHGKHPAGYWYRDQDLELFHKSTTTFKDLL